MQPFITSGLVLVVFCFLYHRINAELNKQQEWDEDQQALREERETSRRSFKDIRG